MRRTAGGWQWRGTVVVVALASRLAWGQAGGGAAEVSPDEARAGLSPSALVVTLPEAVQRTPYSGRVYVVLSGGDREPRLRLGDWFRPPQVVAMDVKGVAPGGAIELGGAPLGFPRPVGEIPRGTYTAQAIARRSLDGRVPGQGEGDLYSDRARIEWPPTAEAPLTLALTHEVGPAPARAAGRVRIVEIVSPLLSAFHGREYRIRAAVVPPPDVGESPDPSRPVIYFVTGFGGDIESAARMAGMFRPPAGSAGKRPYVVVPDPTCRRGHSVFADSENNGPWGRALVEELIPAVERPIWGEGGAGRRYVTGISSGGWSSLWLQVTYPEVFRGCWSHCPDPVDFRDFQRIDLYAPGANMYRDEQGRRRPLARSGRAEPAGAGGAEGERVLLWYDDFCRMEEVLGPGGQIGSFEAVFSRRGEDGEPERLFDRATGAVKGEVAMSWERYDIRLVLERNWATLGPKLKGKIHVYAGGDDTFYLEGATRLLKESLERLGSDAEVMIVPGMPHTIIPAGVEGMNRVVGSPANHQSP
jgi:hypothetical protein